MCQCTISRLVLYLLQHQTNFYFLQFVLTCITDLFYFPYVSGASPKIIKLQEGPSDYTDLPKGKGPAVNSTLVPVKGINNLGNTCFFNAVMQVSKIMVKLFSVPISLSCWERTDLENGVTEE